MRPAWLVVVFVACRYDPGAIAASDAAGALDGDGGDDATDLDTQIATPFCDADDPTLVACYPFDGSTQDGSGNQLHASMTNVTFVAGKRGMAMQFAVSSVADVADSPLFDVAELTIEAWVMPSQLPATALDRMGILDDPGQYGLFLAGPNGRLQCVIAGTLVVEIDAFVTVGTWKHVACVYGAGGTMTLYVNGIAAATGGPTGPIPTTGNSPVVLAANGPAPNNQQLVGLIDELRVFSTVRNAAQICAAAECL
jgi:hypothetical protein